MPVPCSNELMATLACVLVSSPSLAKDFPFETRQNRSLSRREERERERERERGVFARGMEEARVPNNNNTKTTSLLVLGTCLCCTNCQCL